MFLYALWIKILISIFVALLVILCSIYARKKMQWKAYEFAIIIVIGVVVFGSGCFNILYAANPEIETVTVHYSYETSKGELFGRKYIFNDNDGNNYELSMDIITNRKIFYGKSFDKDKTYEITYEANSDTILGINEL